MNTGYHSDGELEKVEAVYERLKPLRNLEADTRGWKTHDWRGLLVALLVTVLYGFAAAIKGSAHLSIYLGGVVVLLTWLGYLHATESKRFKLVTGSLRAIADELHELRKKQA
jgi:hypothetical protein